MAGEDEPDGAGEADADDDAPETLEERMLEQLGIVDDDALDDLPRADDELECLGAQGYRDSLPEGDVPLHRAVLEAAASQA